MSEGKLLVQGSPEEILKDDKAREHYLGKEFKM
jgi:ABC-type lipopolysaccharide export system ATPase subunit